MSTEQITHEVAQQAFRSAPAVTVTGAIAVGLTLNEWVAVATLAYIALQFLYLILKMVREHKKLNAKVVTEDTE